jgi:predicted RNA-binding protein
MKRHTDKSVSISFVIELLKKHDKKITWTTVTANSMKKQHKVDYTSESTTDIDATTPYRIEEIKREGQTMMRVDFNDNTDVVVHLKPMFNKLSIIEHNKDWNGDTPIYGMRFFEFIDGNYSRELKRYIYIQQCRGKADDAVVAARKAVQEHIGIVPAYNESDTEYKKRVYETLCGYEAPIYPHFIPPVVIDTTAPVDINDVNFLDDEHQEVTEDQISNWSPITQLEDNSLKRPREEEEDDNPFKYQKFDFLDFGMPAIASPVGINPSVITYNKDVSDFEQNFTLVEDPTFSVDELM